VPGSATSFGWTVPCRDGVRGAQVSDGRVLRMCSREAGSTISGIGRELGITRQGASKVVAHLRDSGYVAVVDSMTSKREKSVVLTPRGIDYLEHQRLAARSIEDELRAELGGLRLSAGALLNALDAGEDVRLRAYLRRSSGTISRAGTTHWSSTAPPTRGGYPPLLRPSWIVGSRPPKSAGSRTSPALDGQMPARREQSKWLGQSGAEDSADGSSLPIRRPRVPQRASELSIRTGPVRICAHSRHTSLVAICGFMHAVQIVFAVVWAAFWLYWLVAAFSTKRARFPGLATSEAGW